MILKVIASFISENVNICFMAAFMATLLIELRKRKLLIGYLLAGFAGAFILLYSFSQGQTGRVREFIYCVEYMHIPLILYLIWEKRTVVRVFLEPIDKMESYLSVGVFFINLIIIGYLFRSNSRYVYPCSTTGMIGNYYYNADSGRGITYALTNVTQSNVHSLYRFVLNIFMIPCVLLFNILGHQNWFLGGYYLTFLQAFFNSISALALYRLLKIRTESTFHSACFTILYVISAAYMWTVLLPETYSLTVCLLLVTLYLFQRGAAVAGASAVLSIGINPILCVAYIPYLYKWVRNFLIRYYRFLIPFSIAGMYLGKDLFQEYMQWISRYRETGFTLADQIRKMWVGIFTAGFWGPHTVYVGPYFFQRLAYTGSDIIFLALVVTAALPFVKLKKDQLFYSAAALVIAGGILHGVVGFGMNYGFIYSPLYVPMFVILLAYSVMGYKMRWIRNNVVVLLITLTCFYSGKWLYTLGRDIDKVSFPIMEWRHPEAEMEIGMVEFKYSNHILSSEGKVLLTDVDSIQVSEPKGQIVGTLSDGAIYAISASKGQYTIQFIE